MKNKYPFIVSKTKAAVIESATLKDATNIILSQNPGKFVKTKHARKVEKFIQRLNDQERIVSFKQGATRGAQVIFEEDFLELLVPHVTTKLKNKIFMDLVSARKKALEQSKNNDGPLYVNVDNVTGECSIESKANDTTFAAFKHGKEIPIVYKTKDKPVKSSTGNNDENKKQNKLNSNHMATETKTPAKKVAAKKSAPAKKEKKTSTSDKVKVGASFFFDAAQWKQVEAILKKEGDISVNKWANNLVFAKLK